MIRETVVSTVSAAGDVHLAPLGLIEAPDGDWILAPFHPSSTLENLRAVPQARVQFETRDAFSPAPWGEYDVIAVTGSLPVYDARFERALRLGGRLFAVVGSAPVMDAIMVRRVGEAEWIRDSLFETVIDPLINATASRGFVF